MLLGPSIQVAMRQLFEAAERHLTFKEAAEELSVTPPAMSHRIKVLAGDPDGSLFQRRHRSVEPTEDGEASLRALAASFAKVARSAHAIRPRRLVAAVPN
jgi:LysR family glycine cleavage system transcriptional activator